MFVLTVVFTIHEDHLSEFHQAIRKQAQNSLEKEPGCRQFDVCISQENPAQVFLYEVYDEEAAFDQHVQTPHFADFGQTIKGWVVDKQVHRWTKEG